MCAGYGSGVHGARCIVRSFSTEQPRVWGILGWPGETKALRGNMRSIAVGFHHARMHLWYHAAVRASREVLLCLGNSRDATR